MGIYPNEISSDNLKRIKANIKEFKLVYDTYFERIFNFLYRRTGDENDASDLTSRTFLKGLSGIEKYEDRGLPFSAWLYRIATNELYRFYRKKHKFQIFSIEEDRLRQVFFNEIEEEPDERLEHVQSLLQTLDETELNLLELRFFEGLEFQEIAFVTGKKESAIKMRVYRTLQKLKVRLVEIKKR